MANSAKLTRAEISAYLGKERTKILDDFKEKEWEQFGALELDPRKSYFVLGNKSNLPKFEAYFLFLCGFEKPLYRKYMIMEYAELLRPSTGQDDSLNVGVDNELVILYSHNVDMGIGNTDLWVYKSVLSKIVSRNREGNPTIVLSERAVALFQNSGEMEVIDLGGGHGELTVHEALSEIKETPKNEGNSEYVCY